MENLYDAISFSSEGFPIKILWDMRLEPDIRDISVNTWHEQFELLYFVRGGAYVECGFRRFATEDGDIIIINPCEAHALCYRCGAPRYHCIMIDPALYTSGADLIVKQYIEPMSKRRLHFNNLIRGNAGVRSIVEELLRECSEKRSAYEIAVQGHIMLLLSELFRGELRAVYSEDEIIRLRRGYEQIAPALRLISETYTRELPLGELAAACMLDKSYFCRKFKSITLKTVVEYINEYRIAKAEALLLTTNLSISQVASAVGYSDGNYFSRCYRKLRGIAPSKTRLENKIYNI